MWLTMLWAWYWSRKAFRVLPSRIFWMFFLEMNEIMAFWVM